MPHGDRSEDSKEQVALKKRLTEALKEEGNNSCAECGSKQPRWASTNLGVFVCIRCSGIHRNLGVHISKVKSVTLDSWTPPLVEFMEEMGNDKANAYWEANLPTGRKPRESDSTYTVEAFMREKYERRKFVDADEEQPAPKETKPKKKKKKVVQETEEDGDDHGHGEPGEEGQPRHHSKSGHHKHKKHHKQSKHKGGQHETEDVESAFQKLRATEVEGASASVSTKPKPASQSQSSGQPDLLPNIASLGQQAQPSKSAAPSDFDVFTSAGSASGAGSSAGFSAFFSDGPAPSSSPTQQQQQASKPSTSSLDLFAALSGPSQSQPQPQQSVQQQQVAPKPAGPGTKDILAMFDGPRFPTASAQQQPQMMPMQMQMQSNPYGSSMYPSLGRGAPPMMMQPQQQPMMMQPMRQPVPMSGYGQPQVTGMYPQLQSQPQGYGMVQPQQSHHAHKPSLSDISSMYGPSQPSPASRSSLSMMPQAQPTYSLNMNLSMTMSGAQAQSTSFAFSTGPSSRPAPQPQQQKSSNDFSLL